MKRMQNQTMPVKKQTWRDKATYVKKNWQLYLFFLMPGLLLTIIFKYLPMGGLLIAFEDYNVIKGCLEVHGLDLNISGGFYLHRIL